MHKMTTTYSLRYWRRPPRRPCITPLNTVQQELYPQNLTLTEADDLAYNGPEWWLSVDLLVVHTRTDVYYDHVCVCHIVISVLCLQNVNTVMTVVCCSRV